MDHGPAHIADDYLDDLLSPILDPEDGQLIQVLYLQQEDGTIQAFVGAPMTIEQLRQVKALALGEVVAVELCDGSEDEEWATDHGSRCLS